MTTTEQGFTESLRYEYPELNEDSIVIDGGAYQGAWALEMHRKYGCEVHAFEPIPDFSQPLSQMNSEKIKVHPVGIGAFTRETLMAVKGDMSGQNSDGELRNVLIVSLFHFVEDVLEKQIAVLKLNVEGMEYEILEAMLKPMPYAKRFQNIQVQFHGNVPYAQARYDSICERLSKTHEPTWNFGMVWSNWGLK